MADRKADNITRHEPRITPEARERLSGHRGAVLWFTGLSAAGKSTVANLVDHRLHEAGVHTFLLDGDNLRGRINRDLGFSPTDRKENIRRIGDMAHLFVEAGIIVLVAVISPYSDDRDAARALVPAGRFVEIFVDTPLEICETRDPKGLYERARAGQIPDFTGVDAPYEPPRSPELVLAAGIDPPDKLADAVIAFVRKQGLIS
jgi:adenylylsulfate kinase